MNNFERTQMLKYAGWVKLTYENHLFIKDLNPGEYDLSELLRYIEKQIVVEKKRIIDETKRTGEQYGKDFTFWEFEKLKEVKTVIEEWRLKKDQPLTTDQKLSQSQIALIYFYNGKQITRDNGNEIAMQMNWKSKYSGEKLYQLYTEYSDINNRKQKEPTVLKQRRKIELFESVIKYIDIAKQEQIKAEIEVLKSVKENNL